MDLAQRLAELSPAKRELLQKRLREQPSAAEPIAIVGMACRFPGAENLAQFARLLSAGRIVRQEVPADRWSLDAYYDPDPDAPGKMNVRHGAFLDRIDAFDAPFFGIAPREAAKIDPQQRLLLETAWEALEHSGLAGGPLAGSATGVFVGMGQFDYAKTPTQYDDYLEHIDAHSGTGNALSLAANRISYALNLRGPSLAVDTACSSGLVSVHLAMQALRAGECAAALAGGVNLIIAPETMIALSKARMLSVGGECRPFDAAARGYLRGEGCGLVVLKRLSDAVGAGDVIHAVIRHSAVNHVGRTSGITAPSGEAQRQVIEAALRGAKLRPDQIDYIEAHGTGTPLGDPIETQALGELFRGDSASRPCYVTSVKGNIGHLEIAAGVAGLIKTVLLMQAGEIYPQPGLEELNPHLRLDGTRLRIPRETVAWPTGDGPRRAGVSSFGFGGANAHVVLESPLGTKAVEPAAPDRPAHLLTLSAKSDAAVQRMAGDCAAWLREHPESSLPDAAFTTNTGRAKFPRRAGVVAADRDELLTRLDALAAGEEAAGVLTGRAATSAKCRVAFAFTGQGSQYPGMGRRLYESEPTFRETIDACEELLLEQLDEPLTKVLYPGPGQETPLDETAFTQPALFAVEFALARLWESWGLRPDLVLGHSVGEYVAATVAGVFSLEDGLRLIAARGRLMQQLPSGGAMAAALGPREAVEAAIEPYPEVSVAAYNAPENTVVSGPVAAVEAILAKLSEQGIAARRLTVSHAFHSPLMEPMLDEFEQIAAEVEMHAPRIPLLSNVTGAPHAGPPTPEYWRRHVRSPVRLVDSMERLARERLDAVLEIGPAAVLTALGKRCQPRARWRWATSLRPGESDWTTLLTAAAELHTAGAPLDWRAVDRHWPRRRLPLPTYPFERSRHWLKLDGPRRGSTASLGASVHPLLGAPLPTALESRLYQVALRETSPRWLTDHRVRDSVVTPAAAYIDLALAAAREQFPDADCRVENLALEQAMFLSEQPRTVQTVLSVENARRCFVQIHSRGDAAAWQLHATVEIVADAEPEAYDRLPTREAVWESSETALDAAEFYARLAARRLDYGPAFRPLAEVRQRGAEAAAKLTDDAPATDAQGHCLHPRLGDACLQLMAALVPGGIEGPDLYLPVAVAAVRLLAAGQPRWVVGRRSEQDEPPGRGPAETITADLWLLDADGNPLASFTGARIQRIAAAAEKQPDPRSWLYRLAWEDVSGTPNSPTDDAFTWVGGASPIADAAARRLTAVGCRVDHTPTVADVSAPRPWVLLAPQGGEADEGERDLTRLLTTLQRLASADQPPRSVTIATVGGQSLDDDEPVDPWHSAVWGLARVAATEHPELRLKLVDLDPRESSLAQAEALARELRIDDDENQLAWRSGVRRAARLRRAQDALPASQDAPRDLPAGPFRLRLTSPGSIDSLRYDGLRRSTALEPGHVEIEVRAAGLNFSDVLKALGLYPGVTDGVVPLGIECSGVVTAVGPGVDRFAIGQAVFGVAPSSFASHAVTTEYALAPKPADLSHAEAATVAIPFLTAYYALRRLADIQPGERVLIHAGAGGVGLAAIQICADRGCEIFATAGSDEKRNFLRDLGVAQVFNSRTLEFADQIREITDQRGVDVVLNSLPGEAIPKSLGLLAAYGRFLEIGKIDIYANRRLGLAPFQDNLSYHAIDLDRLLRQRGETVRSLFAAVVDGLKRGAYRPLPRTEFPAHEITDAFRYMSQRKNIGKVVVRLERSSDQSVDRAIRPDGTYLVTGGTGAIGRRLLAWLAEQRAGGIALLSRRPPSAEQADALRRIAGGVPLAFLAADVTNAAALNRALASLPTDLPPLRGVFHAAGITADELLLKLDDETFHRPLRPKTIGALHLHQATRSADLDLFVLFSSVSSLLGTPGQANYAAGNAFLDGLAAQRRAAGLPATVVNWGPWGEGGMAATAGGESHFAEFGVRLLPPTRAMELLDRVLAPQSPMRNFAVFDVDWSRYLAPFAGAVPPLLKEYAAAGASPSPKQTVDLALRRELEGLALDPRKVRLAEFFRSELAKIMGLAAEQIDPAQSLNTLGLDSLMAIELRNNLERRLDVALPMARFMEGPSIETLAAFVAESLEPKPPSP